MADPEQPNIIVVDLYEDGYHNPPTKKGIKTLPIDPANLPPVGGKVSVSTVKQQPYCLNSAAAGGTGELPAKVISGSAGVFQVDIYGNGFPFGPTVTSATAIVVDLNSTDFAPPDQVMVIKVGTTWYITSSKPYAVLHPRLRISGQLQSAWGGGQYQWKETSGPGGPVLVGATTKFASESGGSQNVSNGTPVDIYEYPAGSSNYFFDMPFGV